MRILLVTHYFPPYDHIASARTGKTAKYLERFGHDVRVIAARNTLTPFREMPVEISPEKVVYTRWVSGLYRIDLALNTLAQRLARTKTYFSAPARGVASGAAVATTHHRSRLTRAGKRVRDALRTALYFPDPQIGWLPFGLRAGRRLLARWPADVILASSGPPTALLIASMLSQEHGIPWIAEFRDLWADNHRYQHPGWRKKIEARLENKIVSTASGLVTVSESLAEQLRGRYSAQVEVVYNGFDPTDHALSATRATSDCLTIVYTGWVYQEQSLDPLFDAMRRLAPAADDVRIVFYGADTPFVRKLAEAYGIQHLVEARDRVPFMSSLHAQAAADILLYLSWNDPDQTGIFSGKLPQYFGARRPILAVGRTDNEPALLIRERGLGFTSADSGEIAARVAEWIGEKRAIGRIPGVPREAAWDFSRENQTRKLERFLAGFVVRSAGLIEPS